MPTSLFEFYLRAGRWMEPLPALPADVTKGAPRACWANGQIQALNYPERFAYVEGYAVPDFLSFPIHHGWVLDRESGRAVELTWETPGREYLGVAICADFLRLHYNREGGALFDFNVAVQQAISGRQPISKMVLSIPDWLASR